MQNIFGGDGLPANTAFGESDIFRNAIIEVMADHQHVEMFVDGVDSERPGWIGRRGQHILFAAKFDDIGRVAAAGALGVEGVNGAPFEGGDGVLDDLAR